ncbi:UDP-N-acetylmuramoyl-tripeptide--D-alanyl-D-alanine ligase [bacterium]|nr:UDP-N-acetylmuramoyl-tripeptide--D-alanyl-D-alanine ligase [bacterium]
MIHLQLKDIVRVMEGELIPLIAGNLHILGVSIDTRTIKPGELFFAIKGANLDGHKYLDLAVTKHAIALCVSSKPVELPGAPLIVVQDTIAALGKLARYYRELLPTQIIGITGSVGKTSTRSMISAVLSRKYKVCESLKNYNNLLGLPLSIFQMASFHDYGVLELGINQLGEMAKLIRIARPEHAVLTNILPVHLEGLGSLENIAKEKFKILQAVGDRGRIFLNLDDEFTAQSPYIKQPNAVLCGFSKGAHYRITNLTMTSKYQAKFEINDNPVKLRIVGKHYALEAALAFAVGQWSGVDTHSIINTLEEYKGLPLRMELLDKGSIKVLNDSYNANPLSVQEALEAALHIEAKRRIALLGDMLELGKESPKYHNQIGRLIRELGFDYLIAHGNESIATFEGARASGMSKNKLLFSEDKNDIKEYLRSLLKPGDLVLVKGSHSMHMEEFSEFIMEELNASS